MDPFFSSLNFRHSSLITHHSSLKILYLFGTITHLSSLNIFHIICGLHTCHLMQLFFFFLVSKLTEPKKKKKQKTKQKQRRLGFVWIIFFHHSISVIHHSSLITHHSKYPTPFGTITHFSSLNIFHTICGPHTCYLVRAKLFCGPHHFLFSHFPSFTPVTLPKH